MFLNSLSAISGNSPPPFPTCDWRFNEFANPVAHALHVTWVELMALPVAGPEVGDAIFDVILKRSHNIRENHIRENLMEWINAVGLVFSSLPVNLQSVVPFVSSVPCFILLIIVDGKRIMTKGRET